MADTSRIKERTEVVESDDRHFAGANEVAGDAVKVSREQDGEHHYISLG